MKKMFAIFIFVALITVSLSPSIKVNAKENTPVDKAITVDVIYDNWDDAKNVGEYYYKNNVYNFKCAYRIKNTDKFKVTYISINAH